MKKILIVLTSADEIPSLKKQTGWYLPELAHPYHVLKGDFELTMASPKGGASPCDEGSIKAFENDDICKEFLADEAAQKMVKNTHVLSEMKPEDFDAVIYPGGHGPMFDLAKDEVSHKICAAVYEKGGVVGAVCHGPAALVNVKLSDGTYLLSKKKVTGFSNAEEDAVELSKAMPFMLEDQLVANGGVFSKAEAMWGNHVLSDERVVTGQNPASATAWGEAVKALLK
eukprot:Lithocolla_globosa_v1_NODE_8028_length_870_cov_28.537423.p1 type:complete len:227 gc:universal NODE_8028_length_870_cov_28.537423:186-866(+)